MNWRRFLRRDAADREQQAELESYLDIATAENIARGMTTDAARQAAIRRLGNRTQITEEIYRMNTIGIVESAIRNARQLGRMLRRNPLFASASLLTLAIGIGANTAVFSVVNTVLLKPLPYPDADRLISVQHVAPGAPGLISASGDLRLSASMFFTYADHNRSFEAIGAWTTTTATVTGQGEPEEARVIAVTRGLFEALAVKPALGRWLSEADQAPGAARSVLLSYGYWQRRFGGAPSVLGRNLNIAAQPARIVGVMPAGFSVMDTDADLFLPFQFNKAELILPGFFLRAIARLKPGGTLEQAGADILRMIPVWMDSWPAPPGVSPRNWERWKISPVLRPLRQDVVGSIEQGLWVVMATIGIVFLIACANVANLLLVRAEARRRELAVRAALGAGWGRILGELLIESLALALLGGLIGTAIASILLKALVTIGPASLPRLSEIKMDAQTAAFALGISVFAGLLLGLIPACKHARPGIVLALRSGGRSSTGSREKHRTQNALVVTQVALALVLLVCSGLLIRTFQALSRVRPGYTEPETIQTFRVTIPPTLIAEPERVVQAQQQILEKIAALPGVASAGLASSIPVDGIAPNWDSIAIEDRPLPPGEFGPLRRFKNISPGYLESMGTRLVAGRSYDWADLLERRPAIMISENIAREYWDDPRAAIGRRIGNARNVREIIGVVENVHDNGVQEDAPATVYWPMFGLNAPAQTPPAVTRNATFTIRSPRTASADFLRQIERTVWSVNSNLSVAAVQSMADLHGKSIARTSFTLVMLAIAAGMALLLGLIGIYGVLAYTVAQRKGEVGIRLALGAQPGAVKRMFVQEGLKLTAVGVAIGLAVSAGVSRLLASLLFHVPPFDPATYAATAAFLGAAAAMASYLPARRAGKVDPISTLRSE